MTTSVIQPSFSGGEISPSLFGRVDLARYQTSLRQCRNFIVRQYGGVENRPGTRFVAAAKYDDKPCRLLPFQFSSEQTYVLEIGDRYFRVFMRGEQVMRDGKPVEIGTPWHDADLPLLKYTQSADVMTVCHPDYPPLEIRRYDHDDWRIADVVTQGGPFDTLNIDEAVTVYASGKNGQVTLTASRDIFKPYHRGKLFYLEQKNVDNCHKWETDKHFETGRYCRYSFNYYRAINTNNTGTVAPTHTEGAQFDGGANRVKWQYVHSGTGIVRLDGISADGRSAQATVITRSDGVQELPENTVGPENATHKWAHYAWNSHSGYPGTVTYYQQRLIFAGSRSQPQTVWASRSGDYKDFGTSNPVQDDDAIIYTYAGRQLNQIRHLMDVGALVVLTSSGEYKVSGDQQGTLTPSAFQFSSQGQNGANHVAPLAVGNVALFIQQKGRSVRDLAYSFDVDGFQGNDVTLLAEHLFAQPLVDWAFAIAPLSVVWCIRADGALLGLTYLREQQVAAWHSHPGNGKYEAVCVVSEGDQDAVYFSVQRQINGNRVRYIERLETRRDEPVARAFFVDSGLSYHGKNTDTAKTVTLSGGQDNWPFDAVITLKSSQPLFSPSDVDAEIHLPYRENDSDKLLKLRLVEFVSTTHMRVTSNRDVPDPFRHRATADWSLARHTFAGLDHLEGQQVSVLADGNVAPPTTVSGGKITLDSAAAELHAGLPIVSTLETLDINLAGNETLLDKKKIIPRVTLLVKGSRGIFAATPGQPFYEYPQRSTEFYDEPTASATGTVEIGLASNWDNAGRLLIQQSDPLPLTLLGIIPSVNIGGH